MKSGTARFFLLELTVVDCDAALDWYRDALGFQPALRDAEHGYALLALGDMKLALKTGTPAPGTALLTFEVDDLAAELGPLAALGVHPEGEPKTSPEGYRRAHFRDPDGHRICLFEWTKAGGGPPG